jgi:cell wall-associated NlpC family hydrolase
MPAVTDGRTRAAGAFALSGLFIVATMAPAQASPSWEEAQQQADELGSVAYGLNQDQADLTSRLKSSREDLRSVEKQIERMRTDRREARRDLVQSLVGDAKSGSQDLAADLLAAGGLADVTLVSTSDADLAVEHRQADRAVHRLSDREDVLSRTVRRLDAAHEKQQPRVAAANQRAEQAAALVERMREERASRAAEREEAQAASGGATAVVDYAMAQVGDAYVYGASGPDAWDCSGLTSGAWAQAGVSLPHSSSAQMSSGTPVSSDALVPGDLVFYYSPVSHVGIYIGNGQIVHAANPGTGVQVTSLHSMPFSGAVRPG